VSKTNAKYLVTGSSGHLGEGLVRTLREMGRDVVGLDVLPGEFTSILGSIADREVVAGAMAGVTHVLHAATLHKPHVATHGRQEFIDTNVTGTLNLLEEAVAAKVRAFVYTSTTSVFGDALIPAPDQPAAWITEDVTPIPKNIYGVTKAAAEDLCQLFWRNHKLPCLVLRTSRFFPEADDNAAIRAAYADANIKAVEYLYRRVDVEDVVSAHLLAIERATNIGFRKYIISATTPLTPDDLPELRTDAPSVLRRRVPGYEAAFARLGWRMVPTIDRVYVNDRARRELDWQPRHDFASLIERLRAGEDDLRSPLAKLIGAKGYHAKTFEHGPYPTE
jgi:nucleoside-diphosphate-sugar epimerase